MTQPENHHFGQSLEADIDRVLADVKRGIVTDAPEFVPTTAPNIAERIDAEIDAWNQTRAEQETTTMPTDQTTAPFPELMAAGDDAYDLSVFLTAIVNRYPGGTVADVSAETRQLCIEAGRNHGAWSLRVSPWTGSLTDDDVLAGPPLVDLRGQTEGPDPLTLLRVLLTGGTA
jgi:hypothetical protein